MADVKTVRIGDPAQPGAWLQLTLPWLCPVPTCRRPWNEPRFVPLDYHDPVTGRRIARARVHVWTYQCKHVQLSRELIQLAAQYEREQSVVRR